MKERKPGMKLSPRLQYITAQVPFSANVIDIGADHSYVAINLAKQNPHRHVIASDIATGPLTAGTNNAKKHSVQNVEFRLGNGLSVLQHEDAITVAIMAGMGGTLICDLLDQAPFLQNRYILQPNNEGALVRSWLHAHQYTILTDERIDEQHHIYEVIVAEKQPKLSIVYADDPVIRDAQFYFGPDIPRSTQKPYIKWIETKLEQLQRQKAQMSKSNKPEVTQAIDKCDKLIAYGILRLTQLQENEERYTCC